MKMVDLTGIASRPRDHSIKAAPAIPTLRHVRNPPKRRGIAPLSYLDDDGKPKVRISAVCERHSDPSFPRKEEQTRN
jgi:hypothetical protein